MPLQDLLGHPKIRLLITHGGLNSKQEAVYHGVPFIALPVFADQPINAQKAHDDGYAVRHSTRLGPFDARNSFRRHLRSQAGGACDCGDTSVMKEAGFCERHHGPHAHVGKPILPPELLAISQAVMPLIILQLLQHLRSHSITDILEDQLQSVQDADCFITMLHDYIVEWEQL
ncbi:uncharacterized protein LOC124192956 isoform X1 [Daphnia pulex]|uniref:uncharacterized protein LOC124192956 isoform X1 n=1 Tax=Daphnia pulex TaxID=6669 RepID=UPI001EE0B97E|nr:uncharacterized protein LOC124192956 isoform X1 [Daphnia pulex]